MSPDMVTTHGLPINENSVGEVSLEPKGWTNAMIKPGYEATDGKGIGC